jgi:5-(carboxyamino)imidazole ribonucleotide synthase
MSLASNLRVGILGGGQLGRMLLQSGIDLNLQFHVLDPDPQAPCAPLAHRFEQGDLQDFDAVMAFGQGLDVLTIEIEKVNTEAMEALAQQGVRVFPQPHLVRMIQDKRVQKQFYRDHGIPTADFVLLDGMGDLRRHAHRLPAVQKLGQGGYDGRGVQVLRSEADLAKGFDAPSLLEDLVPIEKELSVMVARRPDGSASAFPLVELVYHPEQNMVDYLLSPADVPAPIAAEAERLALDLARQMDFVGLLAVELFWASDGRVLVNEIAPRPHNSGHHSIEANYTSQYQQLLRAILGLPLGPTGLRQWAAMLNLLGEPGHEGPAAVEGLEETLALEGVYVHLYGKAVTKPFRKMGHATVLGSSRAELLQKMDVVKRYLKIVAS